MGQARAETPPVYRSLYSKRGANVAEPRIGDPRQAANLISFVYGYPDADSLPRKSVANAAVQALEHEGDWALQYGKTAGTPALVEVLLDKLARDQGIQAKAENVLITAGGSQACQMVLDLFVDWGDTVIVEAPTWMGFLYALSNVGANVVGIPMDDEGMDTDHLEARLRELKDQGITPKFIYVISNFQNPTGISTTKARRERILELAKEYGTMILEDDAYHDLRYSGDRIPPVYALDSSDSTMYLGTFSKIMGAGMRLGWLIAPPEIVTRLTVLKVDGGTNVFGSYVTARWAPEHLDDHVSTLKDIYQSRRDAMLDALARYLPEGSTWTTPAGGFFVWVTLPDGVDTSAMRAQAKERGVDYLPGDTCYVDGSGKNQMRLSFSFTNEDQIEKGIAILGEIAKGELLEASGKSAS